ncbi:MAG: hypothetical protein ACRC6T_05375 [Sarcina sp.]
MTDKEIFINAYNKKGFKCPMCEYKENMIINKEEKNKLELKCLSCNEIVKVSFEEEN